MNVLLMADKQVGFEISQWLLQQFRGDVALVVVIEENDISEMARAMGTHCITYESGKQVLDECERLNIQPDIGLLAWWPKLIKPPLLEKPPLGFINTHPSLLPHNRGKHYNFWALVEQAPFGVTLHMVNDDIDSGDIVAQKRISYDWEDTGKTLYERAAKGTVDLFRDAYPVIRTGKFARYPQDLSIGSSHRADELDAASHIDLDRSCLARDFLNLLRARTFSGHPACWFKDQGETFEVRVEITRKNS